MANNKEITLDWSETGLAVYAIIIRMIDGFLMDDADGSFAAAPADPHVSMTEHAVIKGRYELTENRSAWNDGFYQTIIYSQTGASPAPTDDVIIGSASMNIESDTETFLDTKLTETRAGYLDGLGHATTTPAIPTLSAVAGALPSGDYSYRVAALNSWGESIASPVPVDLTTVLLTTPVASYLSEQAGTLPAATYYYRVSAINAVGETLASTEISHTLAATGGIEISWPGIPGATGYRIYGRATGAELLLEEVADDILVYTDDGSLTPAGALPTENDTNGVQVDWAAISDATGYRIYGRGPLSNQSFMVDISGGSTVSWVDDGSLAPDSSVIPKTVDSTSLEGQITSSMSVSEGNVEAIMAQTDKMQFDVGNNIKATSPAPEGAVVTDSLNSGGRIRTDLDETVDDHWVGSYLKYTAGDLIDQVKKVSSYDGTSKTLFFAANFTGTPQVGDTFKLINE